MLFDIHVHTSLKPYLFGNHIYHKHIVLPDLLPVGMCSDLPSMLEGGVNLAVAVHYLPEKELLTCGKNTKFMMAIMGKKFKSKIEDISDPKKPFAQLNEMIALLHSEVEAAKHRHFNVEIAKDFADLKLFLAQGKTVFINSIEGANSLGYHLPEEYYLGLVDTLVELGVCQFTIAHFFDNDIAPSQGGINPSSKAELGYSCPPPDSTKGLTAIGKKFVGKLLDAGIVVDLVHCTVQARADIFAINNARGAHQRPLVMSHTGLRSLAEKNLPNEDDKKFLPTDEEIKEIIRTDGVIGVIFMNYWLNGKEEDNPFITDRGIPDVIKTIKRIRQLEKKINPSYNCDHIALGSDFDGFTQIPDDLTTSAHFKNLTEALRKTKEFTTDEIEKIRWKNYMRVLEKGWGKN